MLNRLIFKVTKFQLPPPKHLGTMVKNIFGGHHAPSSCQIGLKSVAKNIAEDILFNESPDLKTVMREIDLKQADYFYKGFLANFNFHKRIPMVIFLSSFIKIQSWKQSGLKAINADGPRQFTGGF